MNNPNTEWQPTEEDTYEKDHKRSLGLYSPKGVNYQILYQDNSSLNDKGIFLLKLKNKLLIASKKQKSKIDFSTFLDPFFRLADSVNKVFLIFLGPKIVIPLTKQFLVQELKQRQHIKGQLVSTSVSAQKVEKFQNEGTRNFVINLLRFYNTKNYAEKRDQPATVLGYAENSEKDCCFIIKPSNKTYENRLIYEGNITESEITRLLSELLEEEFLINLEVKKNKNNQEEHFKFESTDINQKIKPSSLKDFDIAILDENWSLKIIK